MVETKEVEGLSELDWIQIKKDFHVETFPEKLKRKVSENPFVPFGRSFFIYVTLY